MGDSRALNASTAVPGGLIAEILQAARPVHGNSTADVAKLRQLILRNAKQLACHFGGPFICEPDPDSVLRAIFLALALKAQPNDVCADTQACANLAATVVQNVLKATATEADDRKASRLVPVLADGVELLSHKELRIAMDTILECFKQGCPQAACLLEVIPRCVSRATQATSSAFSADMLEEAETCTGEASTFQTATVHQICQIAWPVGQVARAVAALRELPLTPAEVAELVQKVLDGCEKADSHDLPAIINQLLLMCSKRPGAANPIMDIVTLFARLEKLVGGPAEAALRRLLEVEGTVWLELELAVKQNAEFGQACMRQLKVDHTQVSPFLISLVLVFVGIPRYKSAGLDVLKRLVHAAYKDDEQRAMPSGWLESLPVLPLPSGGDVEEAVLAAVKRSKGWDWVVQPGVQMALALIEAADVSISALAAALPSCPGRLCSGAAPLAVRTACLGVAVMLAVFEVHGPARDNILMICQGNLLGQVSPGTLFVHVYVLASLVRQQPEALANHCSVLKASLGNFGFMTSSAAMSLLLAVWPICRARRDVLDHVVLLLRKAMFSPDVDSRLLAARGFLFMITQELSSPMAPVDSGAFSEASSSQLSLSQMAVLSHQTGGGLTLLHELTGFLRRCLGQQAAVRQALYQGIRAVVRADPSAHDALQELLLPHLGRFCEANPQLQPALKLEACAHLQGDAVRVVEALPRLLACVRQLVRLGRPPIQEASAMEDVTMPTTLHASQAIDGASELLHGCFGSIKQRLLACELEDFGMDKSTDFSLASLQGELNQTYAVLLLGVLEVLLEETLRDATDNRDEAWDNSGADILKVFEMHERLRQLVLSSKASKSASVEGLTQAVGRKAGRGSKRGKAGGADRSGGLLVDHVTPVLSTSALIRLLNGIVADGLLVDSEDEAGPASLPAHKKLARDGRFVSFVFRSSLALLQTVNCEEYHAAKIGMAGGQDDTVQQLYSVPDWRPLAPALARAVQLTALAGPAPKVKARPGTKKEREAPANLLLLAVQCLAQLVAMCAATRDRAALAHIMQGLQQDPSSPAAPPAPSAGLDEDCKSIAARLPLLKDMLWKLLEHSCHKEVEVFAHMLAMLGGMLPTPTASIMSGWALQACIEDHQVSHTGATKALVALYVRLAGSADVKAARKVASELATVVGVSEGTVTQEDGHEASEELPVITEKSAAQIGGVLFAHLEGELQRVAWLLQRLALLLPSGMNTTFISPRQATGRRQLEDAAYGRLGELAQVLCLCLRIRLAGPTCDHLVRCLITAFKVLGLAAKLNVTPKGMSPLLPSKAFQRLVSSAHSTFTPAVYNFIHDDQALDTENTDANVESMEASNVNKIKREARHIPALIFEKEKFEMFLIKQSKAGKLDLMRKAKRSTNRDFKLKSSKRLRSQSRPDGPGSPTVADVEAADVEDDGSAGEEQAGEGEEMEEDAGSQAKESDADGSEAEEE
ncbi:hypothetical protein WJX72_009956 [[Myrmecia] bisecta]|uniref:Fanconi anemia group I protein n=1 Tax=[Myrmecia] bisecta TaxID=41462 RepID=A0AAW1P502_9CHLO